MARGRGRSSSSSWAAVLMRLLALALLVCSVQGAVDYHALVSRVAWAALNGPVPQPVRRALRAP